MRAPAPIRRASRPAGSNTQPTSARVAETSAEPSTTPSSIGATALVIERIAETETSQQRRRTPLSVVPAVAKSRRAPAMVVALVLVLLAALGGVLMLNIQVSSGQYELVKLRGQESTLTQENEALAERVQSLESPQNLAAQAAKLGMVASGDVASIDLSAGNISGVATPSTEEDAVTSFVKKPVTQAEKAAQAKAAAEKKKAERAAADAQEQNSGAEQADAGQGLDRPTFSEAELNGGTIPAPTQNGNN